MELPAIMGGKPVRNSMLPYGYQWVDEEDITAVVEVLRSDWITQGPKVDEFEEKVAGYCGAKYAVAMANGTAALHAACSVAGISAGDEAITTPITFAATANAVVYCGGRPVFADIREDTLNIDPGEIERRITPRTKAILPVDFAGHPADLDEIMAIARSRKIIVIEDACHALGAEYRGRKTGGLADMTVFSFHPVKHITTGEGGMVTTNSKELYEKLKTFRQHGIIRGIKTGQPWYYEIPHPGYNFRLTDFQCALGISQLNKLDRFVARRREIVAKYNNAFSALESVTTPFEEEFVKAAYHIYIIQLRTEQLKVSRQEVFNALRAENIGVNVHYVPVHLHPFYQKEFGYKRNDYPRAEAYYERAITIPLFPKMSDEDADDVIKAVKEVVHRYRK
jgi:UDP-4-amino-4,6-dideoxy-N-acetyl-beta-L-altrosamine transaminase